MRSRPSHTADVARLGTCAHMLRPVPAQRRQAGPLALAMGDTGRVGPAAEAAEAVGDDDNDEARPPNAPPLRERLRCPRS